MNPIKRKNRRKKIRVVVQVVLLIILAVYMYRRFYEGSYHASQEVATTDKFIALSYTGVEKYDGGSTTRISQDRLEEHLEALAAMGYTTISQEDIYNLYTYGNLVPEQSMFLMFEDGRRDTGVFAHPLLKEYNYLASMMTYGEKFEYKDNRFLSARDMQILLDTSFWEYGSNGYRLEYINVYDKEKNYLGYLNSDEFNNVSSILNRDYDHYLMDYIRDEDRIPMETYGEMATRIKGDYDAMEYLYEKHMGEVPSFYTLMHSNTGQFGTHANTSEINEENIRAIFSMNMNREGYSLNTLESSIYDLTRMQPQANWYTNHLIMRIVDDTGEAPMFVEGDKTEASKWLQVYGASEYRGNAIVVTSEPNSIGEVNQQMDLNNSTIKVNLDGNQGGVQRLILSTQDKSKQVVVALDYNVLSVQNITGDKSRTILSVDVRELDNLDEIPEEIGINERGSRMLEIQINGEEISIYIDGMEVAQGLNLTRELDYQLLILQSSAITNTGEQYSQRNLVDDVYDGVFTDLTITRTSTQEKVYSYTYMGLEKVGQWIRKSYEEITMKIMEIF